jgi:hypothetical protein
MIVIVVVEDMLRTAACDFVYDTRIIYIILKKYLFSRDEFATACKQHG